MNRPNLVELYEEYCKSFPFCLTQSAKPSQWTAGVHGFWIDQGKGRQYEVKVRGNIKGTAGHPRHPNHAPNGFMIDVVWEDMADGHRCLQLVMEYEYSKDPDEQELDFRKLLHVSAYGKVFIFEVNKGADSRLPRNTVDRLRGLIKGYEISQQPAEEYLLICHRDGPDTYTTISGFLVPSDGGEMPGVA